MWTEETKWTEEVEEDPTLSKGDARLWEQDRGTRTEERQSTTQDAPQLHTQLQPIPDHSRSVLQTSIKTTITSTQRHSGII